MRGVYWLTLVFVLGLSNLSLAQRRGSGGFRSSGPSYSPPSSYQSDYQQRLEIQKMQSAQRAAEYRQRLEIQKMESAQRAAEYRQKLEIQKMESAQRAAEYRDRLNAQKYGGSYGGSYRVSPAAPAQSQYRQYRSLGNGYYQDEDGRLYVDPRVVQSEGRPRARAEQPEEIDIGGGRPDGDGWRRRVNPDGSWTSSVGNHQIKEWMVWFRVVRDNRGGERLESIPKEDPSEVAARERARIAAMKAREEARVKEIEAVTAAKRSVAAKDEQEFISGWQGWWNPLDEKHTAWFAEVGPQVDKEAHALIKVKLNALFTTRKEKFENFARRTRNALKEEKQRREATTASIDKLRGNYLAGSESTAAGLENEFTAARNKAHQEGEAALTALRSEWDGLKGTLEPLPKFEEMRAKVAAELKPYEEFVTSYVTNPAPGITEWSGGWTEERIGAEETKWKEKDREENKLLEGKPAHVSKPVAASFKQSSNAKDAFLKGAKQLVETEEAAERKYLASLQRTIEEAFVKGTAVEDTKRELERLEAEEKARRELARAKVTEYWEGTADKPGQLAIWKSYPEMASLIKSEEGHYPLVIENKQCKKFSHRTELEDLKTDLGYTDGETTKVLYFFTGKRSFHCIGDQAVMVVESVVPAEVAWDKESAELAAKFEKAKQKNSRGWAVWTDGIKLIDILEPKLDSVSFLRVRSHPENADRFVLFYSDGTEGKGEIIPDFSLELSSTELKSRTLSGAPVPENDSKREFWDAP